MRHTTDNAGSRKRRRSFPLPKDNDRDALVSRDLGPLDWLIARQQARRLRRAVQRELTKLPAEQRSALRLCRLEGKSVSEVAYSLRVPDQTIYSRLRRAEEALRRNRVLQRVWQDAR